jgi:hypothetical protein
MAEPFPLWYLDLSHSQERVESRFIIRAHPVLVGLARALRPGVTAAGLSEDPDRISP